MSDAPADNTRMVFRYDVSSELLQRLAEEWQSSSPEVAAKRRSVRRAQHLAALTLGPLVALATVGFYATITPGSGSAGLSTWPLAVALGLCASWLAYAVPAIDGRRGMSFARFRSTARFRGYLGLCEIEIDGRGVRGLLPHVDFWFSWLHFTGVIETPSFLVLVHQGGQTLGIWKPGIAETTDVGAVLAFVQAQINAASRAEPAFVAAFAEGSHPCPNCRYDLHGITTDHCPECGHRLTVGDANRPAPRPQQN